MKLRDFIELLQSVEEWADNYDTQVLFTFNGKPIKPKDLNMSGLFSQPDVVEWGAQVILNFAGEE